MQTGIDAQKGEVLFPDVVERPVMWGYDSNTHQADRYKAIVDPKTGKLFSIVSRDYRLIRHEAAIEQVENAIAETHGLGRHRISTEFYNGGGRMRRKYVFTEISVEIQDGDEVNPEIQLLNSYDTAWPFIVILGAFRLICTNGLVIGKKFLHVRKRHVVDLDKIGLEEEVSTALERFLLQTDQWKTWADRQLTLESYDGIMESMKLGKRATEEIRNRMRNEKAGDSADGFPILTLWVFFNILTWFITHRAVSLNHRVEMEKRLRAAMVHFGRNR
jgi:uncharacterized protein DUF932